MIQGSFGQPLDVQGSPCAIQGRFLMDLGWHFGGLWDVIFEKIVLESSSCPIMFAASFPEAFVMSFGCSREPPGGENPLKFMQLSSKMKVRRICGQGGSGMLPGSIFNGF